jgi:hypothetical protein
LFEAASPIFKIKSEQQQAASAAEDKPADKDDNVVDVDFTEKSTKE